MDRTSHTTVSSPRVTTRFEVAQVPSLRQLLAPALSNGLLDTDSLQLAAATGSNHLQSHRSPSLAHINAAHMPPFHRTALPSSSSGTTHADSSDDSQMPPLIPHSSSPARRPVRSAARAARAAMAAAAPPHATAAAKPDASPKNRHAKRRASDVGNSSSSPSHNKRTRSCLKPPPNAKKDPDDNHDASCAICMCEPDHEDVSNIDGCSHLFCFECIGKWADTENTCPLCKTRFCKITRVNPTRKKKSGPTASNVKRVKHQDQRSDVVSGAALENLLASIAASGTLPGMAGSRLGYFFASMGNHHGVMHGVRTSARVTTTFSLEDTLFDNSEDDEDDESFVPVPNFMNVIMRSTMASHMQHHQGSGGFGLSPPFLPPFAMAAATRSYASNAATAGAGTAAENPLEIDDSDDDENENADDDDDDVQVVQVTRRA